MNEFLTFFESLKGLGDIMVGFIVVIFIMRGWIVPRSALTDVQAERDHWRDAYFKQSEVTSEVRKQHGELLQTAKLSGALLSSFKEQSETTK